MNSLCPDYQALLATVADRCYDDAPKLVLADWLDDHGHDLDADGWRWVVAKQRVPCDESWASFTIDDTPLDRGEVPRSLLRLMADDDRFDQAGRHEIGWCDDDVTAFVVLTDAWPRLTDEQRAEAWAWSAPNWRPPGDR